MPSPCVEWSSSDDRAQLSAGSRDWLHARCGVATASRFTDARQKVGALSGQQLAYVNAIRSGLPELEARDMAGYKAKPTSGAIAKAIQGQATEEPGADAIKYAWLIAMETISREPLDETFVTYAMRRGRELEPRARMVYERRTGALVEEVSLILTDDERFGYSADGFVDDDGLVEIKCPLACDKLGQVWESPETAHLEYIDQINGGLWITGRLWCDLIVYCPWLEAVGKDLFVKRIYRDDNAIEALESDLVGFMRLVDRCLEILRRPTKMTGRPKDEAVDVLPIVPAASVPTPGYRTVPTATQPKPAAVPKATPAAALLPDLF
ncbi:lambda exonuclease family protein [Ottowia sp. VDI28]|uniref:lambda exonuclease family protein n=1 Tax=Ottowia sp. VDI28 TaxID=3133968 RepID=UPI003C2E6B71